MFEKYCIPYGLKWTLKAKCSLGRIGNKCNLHWSRRNVMKWNVKPICAEEVCAASHTKTQTQFFSKRWLNLDWTDSPRRCGVCCSRKKERKRINLPAHFRLVRSVSETFSVVAFFSSRLFLNTNFMVYSTSSCSGYVPGCGFGTELTRVSFPSSGVSFSLSLLPNMYLYFCIALLRTTCFSHIVLYMETNFTQRF